MTEPGSFSFPFPHHFRDPGRQMKLWTEKLSEVEHKRTKYQEMTASDLITFDELRSRLSELEETRRTAERELATLRNHQEHVWQMEQDRDALLESRMRIAPQALESLPPEERHQFYKMLRLEVTIHPNGAIKISWVGSPETISALKNDTGFCTPEVSRFQSAVHAYLLTGFDNGSNPSM